MKFAGVPVDSCAAATMAMFNRSNVLVLSFLQEIGKEVPKVSEDERPNSVHQVPKSFGVWFALR